jgi:hypothetical protein
MPYEEGPTCARHESSVPMSLATIHTEATHPDEVVGLFECPQCGYQRRLPLRMAGQA